MKIIEDIYITLVMYIKLIKVVKQQLLILTVAMLVLCACTPRPRHEDAFICARAVMDSCPECALAILDSIPTANLQPGLDSARYILLHALAENKAHCLTTSDSLLQSILPVFQRHRLNNDLRTANYILGTSLDYQERYSEAIGYLIDAEYLIDNSTNPYEKGLIYNELAECCNATLNGELAIKYIRLAYDAFISADKPLHAAYALHDHATFLNNNAQYGEAIPLFQEACQLADTLKFKDLEYAAKVGMAISNFGLRDYAQTTIIFRALPSGIESMDNQAVALWAMAEHRTNNTATADSLAKILSANDDHRWIYAIDPHTTPVDSIVNAFQKQQEADNRLYLDTYRDKFPTELERNLSLREKLSKSKLRYTRVILAFLSLLIILMLTYGYSLFKNYCRRLKEKEDALFVLTNDFIVFSREQRKKVSNSSHKRDEAIFTTKSIMRQRITLLHDFLYTYHGRPENSKLTFKELTQLINQIMEDLRKDSSTMDELINMLNVCHDDIITRLKTEVPELDEEDLRLFIYIASGFTTHIICKIYEIEPGTFRVRKTRLRKKLLNYDTPSSKEFVQFF